MAAEAFLDEHLVAVPLAPQRVIEVTAAITIASDAFAFALPVHGLAVVPAPARCSPPTATRRSTRPMTTAC